MDNSVVIVLISESARIDTVISQIIERHTEAESDRKRQNCRNIRDIDNAGDEREEISCAGYGDKSDPARKLHLEAVP